LIEVEVETEEPSFTEDDKSSDNAEESSPNNVTKNVIVKIKKLIIDKKKYKSLKEFVMEKTFDNLLNLKKIFFF
jgi:hypothetical protein